MRKTSKVIFVGFLWLVIIGAMFQFNLNNGLNRAQAGSLLDTVNNGGLKTIGSEAYSTSAEPTDIRVIVTRILKILFGFLGIIFIGLTIWAGYTWMMAGGDSSKIDEAKNRLVAGVIGLLIIFSAWSITTYVTDCVMKVTTNSGNVWLCPAPN